MQDVSLELGRGRVLAVLGPSGCGKSTLLRAIAGLEPLAAGGVGFDGADLAGVPPHRRGFGLLFQDGQLFEHLSVGGNIGYGLRALPRARRPGRDAIRGRVEELLGLVGLAGYASRRPATLSGGERQRVALARSLAPRPRLLLLDEPLSALDRGLRERLAADLRRVLTTTGTTALLVTHDHDEALTVADDLALMRAGRIVQHGRSAEVWASPADEQAARFLGYATILRGDPARALTAVAGLPAADAVALRRSAVLVGGPPADGPAGVVREVAAGPDVLRVEVDVTGIGVLAAILAPGTDLQPGATFAPGERVGVRVDPRGIATLPSA